MVVFFLGPHGVEDASQHRVDDLGPMTFQAGDNQGRALPEKWWDRASGMSVSYDVDPRHRFSVGLEHARGLAEGGFDTYCKDGLADGSYLACDVDVRDDGAVVITNTWALRPFPGGGPDGFMVAFADELDTVDPDRLWFEHRVKVIKSETFVTFVSETLRAPSLDAAEAAFAVPVADLVEIATDPQVVIPAPEPDPVSGCPGFVLPGSGVTCGTVEEPTPEG